MSLWTNTSSGNTHRKLLTLLLMSTTHVQLIDCHNPYTRRPHYSKLFNSIFMTPALFPRRSQAPNVMYFLIETSLRSVHSHPGIPPCSVLSQSLKSAMEETSSRWYGHQKRGSDRLSSSEAEVLDPAAQHTQSRGVLMPLRASSPRGLAFMSVRRYALLTRHGLLDDTVSCVWSQCSVSRPGVPAG